MRRTRKHNRKWALARAGVAVGAALLCIVGAGCGTPAGQYLGHRGRDLRDSVRAEVGVGWPLAPLLYERPGGQGMRQGGQGRSSPGLRYWLLPRLYLRAKATDFLVVGDGFAQPVRYGLRGRYRPVGKAVALDAGLPLLRNDEECGGTAVHTDGPCLTTRTYVGPPPPPGGRVAERLWIGASATVVLSVELGFNPAELADFLVGWSGWDMLGDDDWAPWAEPVERRTARDQRLGGTQ